MKKRERERKQEREREKEWGRKRLFETISTVITFSNN